MVQYYGDPRREDAECVVTSQRRLEKREIVMRVHVQQSTYTVLYLAKTKDTSYDVAKVRDIRKGTGYQQVTLSIHGKSGDQDDK